MQGVALRILAGEGNPAAAKEAKPWVCTSDGNLKEAVNRARAGARGAADDRDRARSERRGRRRGARHVLSNENLKQAITEVENVALEALRKIVTGTTEESPRWKRRRRCRSFGRGPRARRRPKSTRRSRRCAGSELDVRENKDSDVEHQQDALLGRTEAGDHHHSQSTLEALKAGSRAKKKRRRHDGRGRSDCNRQDPGSSAASSWREWREEAPKRRRNNPGLGCDRPRGREGLSRARRRRPRA